MNVDLLAPLGPRRPVPPGGTETLTWFRPMTWPYHFETCSAVTTAVLMSPPLRRGHCSSGGLRPPEPPHTLARGVPRAPRSARVAHSLSLVRAASCHHLYAADPAFEHRDGHDDQADDHEQRHLPRRRVARLQAEDDIDDLRDVGADGDPGHAAAARDGVERAVNRRREERDADVENADVARALRQGGEREHRERGERDLQQRRDDDRRHDEQVGLQKREVAVEHHLQDEQQQRRDEGDEDQEGEQHRQLARDVLRAHQRLGQGDLHTVRRPIVGDQARADVHGDDEDEEILLFEKLPEGLGRRAEYRRRLRIVRADVQLHGPDDERRPGEEEQAHEHPLLDDRPDAGPRDDQPRAARHGLAAAVVAIALIVNGAHCSPIALAKTSSSVGTLGRRCRTCTPNCAAGLKIARWALSRDGPARPAVALVTASGTDTRKTSSSVPWTYMRQMCTYTRKS